MRFWCDKYQKSYTKNKSALILLWLSIVLNFFEQLFFLHIKFNWNYDIISGLARPHSSLQAAGLSSQALSVPDTSNMHYRNSHGNFQLGTLALYHTFRYFNRHLALYWHFFWHYNIIYQNIWQHRIRVGDIGSQTMERETMIERWI